MIFQESQLTEMTEAAATQDSLRENTLGTKTDHISDSKKHLSDESGNVNQTCAIINKSASVDLVNGHIEKKIDNNETQIQANFVKLDSDLTKAKKKEPPQKQFDRPDPLTNVDTNSHTACASNMVSDRKKALKQDDDTSCLEDDLDMLLSFDKPKNAQKTVQNGTNVQEHLIDSATVNGSDMHVTKGEFHMSCVVRKPVFGVSDQVRHKLVCTTTEDG